MKASVYAYKKKSKRNGRDFFFSDGCVTTDDVTLKKMADSHLGSWDVNFKSDNLFLRRNWDANEIIKI